MLAMRLQKAPYEDQFGESVSTVRERLFRLRYVPNLHYIRLSILRPLHFRFGERAKRQYSHVQ
jgi:hypothetical protein